MSHNQLHEPYQKPKTNPLADAGRKIWGGPIGTEGKSDLFSEALEQMLLLAQELADARRGHAEAFLRFKLAKQPPTDNVAKAQADIEVDVIMPSARYDVARIDAERRGKD